MHVKKMEKNGKNDGRYRWYPSLRRGRDIKIKEKKRKKKRKKNKIGKKVMIMRWWEFRMVSHPRGRCMPNNEKYWWYPILGTDVCQKNDVRHTWFPILGVNVWNANGGMHGRWWICSPLQRGQWSLMVMRNKTRALTLQGPSYHRLLHCTSAADVRDHPNDGSPDGNE